MPIDAWVHVQHRQTAGTSAGDSVTGWQTHPLDTLVTDTESIASLGSSQLTLPAGEYVCYAYVPLGSVYLGSTRLRDVTNSADLVLGHSVYTINASVNQRFPALGAFTLADTTVIELQTKVGVGAVDGLGYASGFQTEIYADILIGRIGEGAGPSLFATFRNHQSSGVAGGDPASTGSFVTCPLNTEVVDTIGASLSSNQVTLPAGTYVAWGQVLGHYVEQFNARLRDVTGSATLLLGGSANGDYHRSQDSIIQGLFTLSVTSALELQAQVTRVVDTDGWGEPAGWGTEVFSGITFAKLP